MSAENSTTNYNLINRTTLRSLIIQLCCHVLNKFETYLTFLLRNLKSKVVKYSRKQYQGPDFQRFHGFSFFVNNILLFPYNLFYYIYLFPTIYVYSKLWKFVYILFRRKFFFRKLLSLSKRIIKLYTETKQKLLATEIIELLVFCVGASLEVHNILVSHNRY